MDTMREAVSHLNPFSSASRVHPTLNPETLARDLASNTAPPPASRRFEADHLSETLCAVARSNVLRRLLPGQIRTVRAKVPRCEGDEEAITSMLKTWFDIFNAAFFGGGLVPLRGNIRLGNCEGHRGNFHRSGRDDVGRINITLGEHLDARYQELLPGRIEHDYIATLLHEMLHAFMYYYGCVCNKCRAGHHASKGGCGPQGHGPPWANAMLGIGQAFQDLVPWPLAVSMKHSVKSDMKAQNWQATDEDMARWGLTPGVGGIIRRHDPISVFALTAEAILYRTQRKREGTQQEQEQTRNGQGQQQQEEEEEARRTPGAHLPLDRALLDHTADGTSTSTSKTHPDTSSGNPTKQADRKVDSDDGPSQFIAARLMLCGRQADEAAREARAMIQLLKSATLARPKNQGFAAANEALTRHLMAEEEKEDDK